MKKTLLFAGLIAAAMVLNQPLAYAQQVTIPIIVKDTTSFYWQIVLAGARKAGKDLNVNVPELGAQSESDINGQISILENAVAGKAAYPVPLDDVINGIAAMDAFATSARVGGAVVTLA